MQPTEHSLEMLRTEANNLYYKLLARLGDDKSIAKKIAPLYQTNVIAVQKYLEAFSFRNANKLQRFIKTATQVLADLDTCPIYAKALLLCESDESELRIKERAKHLMQLGIHTIVPQLLIAADDEQFWDFVKQDIKHADFIIAPRAMFQSKNDTISDIAQMYNLEIIENERDDDIKAHAIQISIKLIALHNKFVKKKK